MKTNIAKKVFYVLKTILDLQVTIQERLKGSRGQFTTSENGMLFLNEGGDFCEREMKKKNMTTILQPANNIDILLIVLWNEVLQVLHLMQFTPFTIHLFSGTVMERSYS